MSDLIGLSGYARSGKDTVAAILGERGYGRAAFADALRDVLYQTNPTVAWQGVARIVPLASVVDCLGWERAKTDAPEIRELMQDLGDALKSTFGPSCLIDATLRDLPARTVVADVRFPAEADAIRAAGGVVWRITRHDFGPANGHASETALDGYDFDWHVWNNGSLDALRGQILADVYTEYADGERA